MPVISESVNRFKPLWPNGGDPDSIGLQQSLDSTNAYGFDPGNGGLGDLTTVFNDVTSGNFSQAFTDATSDTTTMITIGAIVLGIFLLPSLLSGFGGKKQGKARQRLARAKYQEDLAHIAGA